MLSNDTPAKSMVGYLVCHYIKFKKRVESPISNLNFIIAINYRLAPQYPFPCGLQDALAACKRLTILQTLICDAFADLFLIRPPPDSDHQAIDPAHILISGDSAGGGLSLALLQVIRDSGLPPPAGGILVSPWCDLSHSFPSIHINTKTVCIVTQAQSPSLSYQGLGHHS